MTWLLLPSLLWAQDIPEPSETEKSSDADSVETSESETPTEAPESAPSAPEEPQKNSAEEILFLLDANKPLEERVQSLEYLGKNDVEKCKKI